MDEVTPETKFNSAPVVVTEVAPSVNGVGTVTVPVKVGDVRGANAEEENALLPSVPPAPMLSVEPSVPVKLSVLLAVSVFPSAMVRVEPVAGAVMESLLRLVAVAVPMFGVVNEGEIEKTSEPVPVSSDNTPSSCADVVGPNTPR